MLTRATASRGAVLLADAATLLGVVLLLPAPASAATPDCFDVDFGVACATTSEFTFTDDALCAFPVDVSVIQGIRYRPVLDRSGELSGEVAHIGTRATIVNPATDRSFTDNTAFTAHTTFLADGSELTRTTGILHNAQVDTGERLFHQSGRHVVLLDPEGEVVGELFNGNFQSEAAFPGDVCPLLAQPA